jgi:hypothetical protein
MTDYKKEGKVTFWGRVAAIGATISLLFSVVLLGLEQRSLADSNRLAAQEKNEANAKFDGILSKVGDNITATNETLIQTGSIAGDVKKSVGEQAKILKGNERISSDLKDSIEQQQRTIEGIEQVSRHQLQSNRKQKEIQDQQGVILQNTLRSITLLNPLAFRFGFRYSVHDPRFQQYVNRMQALAETKFKNAYTYDPDLGVTVIRRQDNNKLASIEIDHRSKLFPARNERGEAEPGYELNLAMLNLAFYKDAPSIKQKSSANLRIQAVGWNPESGIPPLGFKSFKPIGNVSSRMELFIDFEKETISQRVFTDSIDRWPDGTNPITSLVDLQDTLLEVSLPANPPQALESFEIRFGENYTRIIEFATDRFEKEPDGMFVKWYHRLTKQELKLPF